METKRIYLIHEYGEEEKDSWERIAYAFLDKDSRDKKIRELNFLIEKWETYRPLWNEITDALNNAEYDEYDKYIDYLNSDSFERFIYWMEQIAAYQQRWRIQQSLQKSEELRND